MDTERGKRNETFKMDLQRNQLKLPSSKNQVHSQVQTLNNKNNDNNHNVNNNVNNKRTQIPSMQDKSVENLYLNIVCVVCFCLR